LVRRDRYVFWFDNCPGSAEVGLIGGSAVRAAP
jgi:hypothetical protein